jgi:cytochrome P450
MQREPYQPDLQSVAYLEDPAPTLSRLREEDPVHQSRHGYWFLTRYDDVKEAIRSPRYSSDWSRRPGRGGLSESPFQESQEDQANRRLILSSFNMKDGGEHMRVRSLVNIAFSRAALDARRERIESLAGELLDAAAAKDSFDLVSDFGFQLPIIVASEMIGIPASERDRFRRSFEDAALLGLPGHHAGQHAKALKALDWQVSLIRSLVDARRVEPRDDLISALVQAEEEGDQLTSDETISAIVTIFTAAGTTTERFVSSGLFLLLQHAEQFARLRADRALMPTTLEEILRFHHPDQSTSTPRWVTEDLELRGKTLARGDRVRFGLGAANRDPDQFADPERFDITRDPNRHLSFGRGAHFCSGASLARLEGEVAISLIMDRMPNLQLVGEAPRRDPRRMDRYERIMVRP